MDPKKFDFNLPPDRIAQSPLSKRTACRLLQMPRVGGLIDGQFVDIIGTSKGKGFQGVYRRFNFGGLPQSHGSMMHRRPGGIGAGSTPGRVWKYTKMPGRQGGKRVTVQNLKVIEARPDDNVLLISGAVPGSKGGYVIIRPAIKKQASAK